MALLVYVTTRCRDDAQSHGLTGELERFQARVESTQSTSLFDPFPPPYLVKKKLGGRQGRLIASHRNVGDHAVVVFLAILMRGSRAYQDEFAVDPISFGKQHLDFVTDGEISSFVEERTRKDPPHVKPEPNEEEYDFLYSTFSHHQDRDAEDLVCETAEWVERVSRERISKQLALFCKPCLESLKNKEPGLHFNPIPDKQNWGIWSMRSPGRLLLLTPATEASAIDDRALAESIYAKLQDKDATTVLRASRRAYPALILADDELWIDLEKEPVANMALSPEESEVLESARCPDHPFPLFINGRAGSGKSTILQYLFADLLFFYLVGSDKASIGPPIYLTANGELLRVARDFIERLLRSEATFTPQMSTDLVGDNRELLDSVFCEFQPHLLSLVPQENRRLFGRASRVDYSRFRRMWIERFGKEPRAFREFGPDLSWHIIRSYIKGMSSETYLEPEDYIQLPQNQITVTHGAFKTVFDRVWVGWYQEILGHEELWDDQDLTRYVLDHDLALPTCPAVVCDEAQDFTRLELELLLRLNLFSNRSLPPNAIRRVPFAFAGDQFQTLNPTGFRWDAIKASFVEKFIFELDPTRRSAKIDLNYQELKYNYRSTQPIVRFGNHIQAMRAAMFELPDLRPQIPWATDSHAFPVVWFDSQNAGFWKKFRENPGFVVVVPCSEGEEADFVNSDPILREQIQTEEGVPVNVLSAARAKGCEYPAVIVYGFGAAAETDVTADLESENNEIASDPDKSLPIQYFFNRLYVAVSRAKGRLVIVDTESGFERLWKCVSDEAFESQMLARIKHGREVWSPWIEGMNVGNPEALTRESAGDPLENAKTFEADGLARRDAFLLRQAAQAYRSAGDQAKARECRARALEVDGNWYEAGEAYVEAGFLIPEGVRCLWHSGRDGWVRLVQELPRHPLMHTELECEWARAIVEKPTASQVADLLGKFANRLNDAAFYEACLGDRIWSDALADVLQPLIQSKQPLPEGDEIWMRMGLVFDRVRDKGINVPPSACAQIYYWARRYPEAISLWERASEVKSAAYHKAKVAITPYPERILSLASIGSTQEIIDSYLNSSEIPLSNPQATAVSNAFREKGRYEESFTVAWRTGIADPMLRLVAPALHKQDPTAARRALHSGLILLVRQGEWEPLMRFASTLEFIPSPEWKEKELATLVKAEAAILEILLVRSLARSESLPQATRDVQQRLGSFLRKYLRVKEGSWRSHLSVVEAGAAIERGGRFTDALSFYEAVESDGNFAATDRLFARQRWLRSKQRQLEYERTRGALVKAEQIDLDIQRGKAALAITNLDELDEFPRLPPLDISVQETDTPKTETGGEKSRSFDYPTHQIDEFDVAKSDPLTLAIGCFKFDFSRKFQRCNIVHTDDMTTAFIKLKELQCGGEVEFKELEAGRWECASWKLVAQLPTAESRFLIIDLGQWGVRFRLQI